MSAQAGASPARMARRFVTRSVSFFFEDVSHCGFGEEIVCQVVSDRVVPVRCVSRDDPLERSWDRILVQKLSTGLRNGHREHEQVSQTQTQTHTHTHSHMWAILG